MIFWAIGAGSPGSRSFELLILVESMSSKHKRVEEGFESLKFYFLLLAQLLKGKMIKARLNPSGVGKHLVAVLQFIVNAYSFPLPGLPTEDFF